ncbi:hypothetical protein MP638_000509 [Amoeboaphelidium occidentale]|nr:hypothetical protein MP638_000509 [Amoeboaphelidium occidentale]
MFEWFQDVIRYLHNNIEPPGPGLRSDGLHNWNLHVQLMNREFNDTEVAEFNSLDIEKFNYYNNNPMEAAEQAIHSMLAKNIMHDDIKWARGALLPSFSKNSDKVDLVPILLDLSRLYSH